MRDLLIRYLLGELDEAEQRRLEERLHANADLRRELEYLRACFSASQEPARGAGGPPRGLAHRTAEHITGLSDEAAELAGEEPRVRPAADELARDEPVAAPRWSMADLSVAGGVFLAVAMLLLPALRDSRDGSRLRGCTNNLRQIYVSLDGYSEKNGGHFPRVGPNEHTGIWVARLVDGGFADPQQIKLQLVCRASAMGDEVAAGRLSIPDPTMVLLRRASGDELLRRRQYMSGTYAYRVGFIDNKGKYKYKCLENRRLAHEPLISDLPSFEAAQPKSANHGGCGTNVLFQDGNVRFLTNCQLPGLADEDLYLNILGWPAAGYGEGDIVLLTSGEFPWADVEE
jgi:hypothetical protein